MKKFLLFGTMLLIAASLFSCGSKKTEDAATSVATDTTTVASSTEERPQQTPDNDYYTPSFPDVGLYIDYVANNSLAGTVEGGGTHRVDSKPAGTVKAIPNLGYRFAGWSDGVKDPVRSGDTTDESKQIVAMFEYDTLELPILHITTETGSDVRSKAEYIGATLSLFNADADYCLDELQMQIRGRGNKTWEYEKKSYKMKLSEKQSLLGLGEGKAKKWVLLANVCDQSLLRNYLALQFAGAMPYGVWSPDCTSVEVYLNGEYRGVYLLCEEIDVNNNKVAIPEDLTGAGSEDIGFLVEISGNPKDPSFECNERDYQIHNDLSTNEAEARRQQRYIEDYIRSCWTAVRDGDEAKIAQLIDIDSMVNAYLVEEVLKNLDCGYDSFYLYREPGGKLTFGPLWDFDNALGNADEGTENYYDLYVAYNERYQSNPWLYTAMEQEWFRDRVVKMWNETADVRSMLSATVLSAGKAGYNSYCRNFEKWDLFGRQWNRETEQITSLKTYTEHYQFLAEWIDQRLAWLDEYYHDETFIPDWDSTPINPENPEPEWPDWGGGNWGDKEEPEIPEVAPPITEGIGNDAAQSLSGEHTALFVDPSSASSTINGNFGEEIYYLFDNDVRSKYCCSVGRSGGWWGQQQQSGTVEITFTLDAATVLSGYSLTTANDTSEYPDRNPESWVLYAQTDDGRWVEIDASSSADLGMGAYDYTAYGKLIENDVASDSYKLVITHVGILQLSELTLYTK
ncbi:MAG: CotH kinase family protein [Clostridia bacterium]|nr:CotH kinase family protein [Clostridia bacterium]